jgi:hypothetical protein
MISELDQAQQKPETLTGAATACPHCGGRLNDYNNAFIWLRKCASCERSRLMGWVSCDPVVLFAGGQAPGSRSPQ